MTFANTGIAVAPTNTNKNVIFKNCAPFINCISQINYTQVDDAHVIDTVLPMYNLIEYSDIYSKISRSLWQYYRHKPTLDNNKNIIHFLGNNNSNLFKFKDKITGQTGDNSTKDVEIMVPLNSLSTF